MKPKIHPKYYTKAKVKCACGAEYTLGSTKENLETEVCAQCHPFYTGKDKIVDKSGMVEKYKTRLSKAAKKQTQKRRRKKQQKISKHI